MSNTNFPARELTSPGCRTLSLVKPVDDCNPLLVVSSYVLRRDLPSQNALR